ncbi:MAG: patatin-like phospholipase family protein [Dehalococcoidia bacterium]
MKVGLSLGGGGALGYAHIGVIRALIEGGVPIDIINGSSMGAIIGGAYALYGDIEPVSTKVEGIVESTDIKYLDLFTSKNEINPFLRRWLANAVCDVSLLRSSILPHKNYVKALRLIFSDYQFDDTSIPFSAVAVDLLSEEVIVLNEGPLVDGILPSISIPGIFPPVERDGYLLVDGSVLADVPVRELRWQGADFIIAVELVGKIQPYIETGFDILSVIEMMKGRIIARWETENADFRISVNIPEIDIFSFEAHQQAISGGYQRAIDALPELHERLLQHGV